MMENCAASGSMKWLECGLFDPWPTLIQLFVVYSTAYFPAFVRFTTFIRLYSHLFLRFSYDGMHGKTALNSCSKVIINFLSTQAYPRNA